jgi:acyl-coenzyme A synthetase/AMP-(fatty) acid ligase
VTRIFVYPSMLGSTLIAAGDANLPQNLIYTFEGTVNGRSSLSDMIEDALVRKIQPVSPRSVEKDTVAYLLFSSGTTGEPQPVTLMNEVYSSHIDKVSPKRLQYLTQTCVLRYYS